MVRELNAYRRRIFFDLTYRGGTEDTFVGFKGGPTVYWISTNGEVEEILLGINWPSILISPDGQYASIFGRGGILLFNEANNVVFEWKDINVHDAVWRTNSQGIYFMTDGRIYYLEAGEQTPQRIIDCGEKECKCGGTRCRYLSILSGVFLPSLPYLRVRPPPIERQTQGTSLWSKATFKDLPEPGTHEYSITLPAYSEWRWDFSWCADTQAGLEAILAPVDLRFYIGGELLGEDIFRIYDTAKAGAYCRKWATLLSGWQPGDQTDLTIRYTLREAVNDGTNEYPPGEYRQIMHVTVTG